jgi:hypothetical protein
MSTAAPAGLPSTPAAKTRVFDTPWGAAQHAASRLVSVREKQAFSNALAATRAAILSSVSSVSVEPGSGPPPEDPFVATALTFPGDNLWSAPVLKALASPSSGQASASVPALEEAVHAVMETLRARGTAQFSDKLARADECEADAVFAALLPRESTWILAASASLRPSKVSDGADADVECNVVANAKRFFGPGGFATVPAQLTAGDGQKAPLAKMSNSARRPNLVPLRSPLRAPKPQRASSNRIDAQIGNKYTNKRLAAGPGRSEVLVELGRRSHASGDAKPASASAGGSPRPAFEGGDADAGKKSPTPEERMANFQKKKAAEAAKRKRGLTPGDRTGVQGAAESGSGGVSGKDGRGDRRTVSAVDADVLAKVAAATREAELMVNPGYRKKKQLEGRARKMEELAAARKRRKEAKNAKSTANAKKSAGKKQKVKLESRDHRLTADEPSREKFDVEVDSVSDSGDDDDAPEADAQDPGSHIDEEEGRVDRRRDYNSKRSRSDSCLSPPKRARVFEAQQSLLLEPEDVAEAFTGAFGREIVGREDRPLAAMSPAPKRDERGAAQLVSSRPSSVPTHETFAFATQHNPQVQGQLRSRDEVDAPPNFGATMNIVGGYVNKGQRSGINGVRSQVFARKVPEVRHMHSQVVTAEAFPENLRPHDDCLSDIVRDAGVESQSWIDPRPQRSVDDTYHDALMEKVLHDNGNTKIGRNTSEWFAIRDFFRGLDYMFTDRTSSRDFWLGQAWNDASQVFDDVYLSLRLPHADGGEAGERTWNIVKVPVGENGDY